MFYDVIVFFGVAEVLRWNIQESSYDGYLLSVKSFFEEITNLCLNACISEHCLSKSICIKNHLKLSSKGQILKKNKKHFISSPRGWVSDRNVHICDYGLNIQIEMKSK